MTSTDTRNNEPEPRSWPHGPVIGWPKPHAQEVAR